MCIRDSILWRLCFLAGHVALCMLIYLDVNVFTELKRRNWMREQKKEKDAKKEKEKEKKKAKRASMVVRHSAMGTPRNQGEVEEDDMGCVGAEADDMEAVIQMDLSGDDGGEWTLLVKDRTLSVTTGTNADADVKMSMQASDWLDGYGRIHGRYREYGHCRIVQEIGLLMNAVRFAKDVGDGISKQVMQGADTDSFGATCGSLLGTYFGPDGLEERWLKPFNNTIHTTVATLHEQELAVLAERVAELPAKILPVAETLPGA